MSVDRAIILAAGLGLRIRAAVDDRPKGLIEFDGESLVERSIRLLHGAGIERITMVVGHRSHQYRARLGGLRGIDFVENADYRTTGSMASLAAALVVVDGPVLVLESDIIYESRAIDALRTAEGSATLVSGVTGAGDEVWVHAVGGRLIAMNKNRDRLPAAVGEFVGITRLAAAGAEAMREIFSAFVAREGHARMSYETDALVELAQRAPVRTVYMPDLVWGEIDDEAQYKRVESVVWPAIKTQSPG